MRSNKIDFGTLGVQRLSDGTFLVRGEQASGRVITAHVEDDALILKALATKAFAREARAKAALEARVEAEVRRAYPSLF